MTKTEFQFVVNSIVSDLVGFLMEDKEISLQEAFDVVYQSELYQTLQAKNTGLYRYSSAYSYEYLKRELERQPC